MKKNLKIHEIDGVRMIVVGNEAFDWGVDEEHFKATALICKNDPEVKDNFLGNIQKHFVSSFSEFLGKDVTLTEINKSLKEGFIEL